MRTQVALLCAGFFMPAPLLGQSPLQTYWTRIATVADSAAVLTCVTLVQPNQHMSLPAGEFDALIAREYGAAARQLKRWAGDAEVIRTPEAVRLNHQQVLETMTRMQRSIEAVAMQAEWATCRQERASGLSCNPVQRSYTFAQRLAAHFVSVANALQDYSDARERLSRVILQNGGRANGSPQCLRDILSS